MFRDKRDFGSPVLSRSAKLFALAILGVGAACFATPAPAQQAGQKTFPFATDAARTLVQALQDNDQSALLNILGPDSKDIISSGDEVEDKNERDAFVKKYHEMNRIVTEPDGKTTLYIGPENWPTPIPLAQKGGQWYFNTDAGRKEILYRRIGKNELAVIQVCLELVDAQKEYYAQQHDGNSGHQYAHKISSDPGKHDGLYWPMSAGDKESPIGPLVASAEAEGYTKDPDHKPQPFQGYYFRMLKTARTGASGGGTAHGFAFEAYPAEYRASGVMTFLVDQSGIVYEKDLGAHTGTVAVTLTSTNRDASWRKAD
jgi:hypothetical protein